MALLCKDHSAISACCVDEVTSYRICVMPLRMSAFTVFSRMWLAAQFDILPARLVMMGEFPEGNRATGICCGRLLRPM